MIELINISKVYNPNHRNMYTAFATYLLQLTTEIFSQ